MVATNPIDVVRSVEAQLNEADALLAEHPAMALVRAVSAFEVFMKRAFLEPYLRERILGDAPDIGEVVVDALLSPAAWRSRLPQLIRSCWKIEVAGMESWSTMAKTWTLRNTIIHSGADCDSLTAALHVENARLLIRALLTAREAAPNAY